MAAKVPRVVMVRRSTDYEALLARHATHGQAKFFLETRDQKIEEVQDAHDHFHAVLNRVLQEVPAKWRRSQVHRDDLNRFLFEPDDIIVALGQDGLVANLAKYLNGQPVIGLNPLPERYDGVLVPHAPEAAGALLDKTARQRATFEARTMVEARLDDGQRLLALNEIFVGHQSHQSARYRLSLEGVEERQSSSGLIVATGTGATGWARSIKLCRQSRLCLPEPSDPALAFFVREAFPSVATGTDLTEGLVAGERPLRIVSEMNQGGVIFGDGVEDDRLPFNWGQGVDLCRAEERLYLVKG